MAVTKKAGKDFERAEGAYVIPVPAGLHPYNVTLYRIERVNGDCSVSELIITEAEAKSVIEQLATQGVT